MVYRQRHLPGCDSLDRRAALHPPYGVRAEALDADPVRLEVKVETRGLSAEEQAEAGLCFDVTAKDGTPVPHTVQSIRWEQNVCVSRLTLESAELWSAEPPVLYTLTAGLEYRGTLQDEAETPFGVRLQLFDLIALS